MSFGDFLRDVGQFVQNQYDSRAERIEEFERRNDRLDDTDLRIRFERTSNSDEKIACKRLLQQRGCWSEDD